MLDSGAGSSGSMLVDLLPLAIGLVESEVRLDKMGLSLRYELEREDVELRPVESCDKRAIPRARSVSSVSTGGNGTLGSKMIGDNNGFDMDASTTSFATSLSIGLTSPAD